MFFMIKLETKQKTKKYFYFLTLMQRSTEYLPKFRCEYKQSINKRKEEKKDKLVE